MRKFIALFMLCGLFISCTPAPQAEAHPLRAAARVTSAPVRAFRNRHRKPLVRAVRGLGRLVCPCRGK